MHEAAPYYPPAFYKALSYHNIIITEVVSNVFMCSFCSSLDGLGPAVQYPIERYSAVSCPYLYIAVIFV